MKTTALISAALALAGAAVAAPTPETSQPKVKGFGLIASRSASPIHLQELNAHSGHIWIGKATASFCPNPKSECPKGDTTVFAGGVDTISMSVEVPGGQQVYISHAGALRFTEAHSGTEPAGSIVGGFSRKSVKGQSFDELEHKGGFFACPVEKGGPYKVYVGVDGFVKKGCLGFDALTSDTDVVGAWEYT